MRQQGFLLFSNKDPVLKTVAEKDRDEWDSIFHDKLPKLLRSDHYRIQFSTIFARVQGDTKHRFGDNLRLQLKLRRALKITNDRAKQKTAGPDRKAEYDLLVRARDPLLKDYGDLVKVLRFVSEFVPD